MKQMHYRFEHWYKLTHWMAPELNKTSHDESTYDNKIVQAMFIAYRAGYNRATKDRKEELRYANRFGVNHEDHQQI